MKVHDFKIKSLTNFLNTQLENAQAVLAVIVLILASFMEAQMLA